MLEKVRLGRTGLMVSRVAMGCIPIQRLTMDGAVGLLRRAADAGVNFFDTAHGYTDSEEKIGAAFAGGIRERVIIATKAKTETYDETARQLDLSLKRLRTDRIDIYQWHNPQGFENFQSDHGPYQAMLDGQKAGKIRFIGITNHSLPNARFAIRTGVFDTLQFPLSVLSTPEELAIAEECRDLDVGVIAMKAMCGGLLDDGLVPFAFLNQYPHIVPIWGVETWEELSQFIKLSGKPPAFTAAMRAEADALRAKHGDDFCRGCGYCLPCPSGINLPIMMRIHCFISRMAAGSQFTPERLAEVDAIKKCTECRACAPRCPYHLDPPTVLKKQYVEYMRAYNEWKAAK